MPYIQNDENSIRSSLARARNHGSARGGTHHWWLQRLTAIALVPLTIWMLFSLPHIVDPSFSRAVEWLENPWSAVGLGLFLMIAFYHAALGLQVIWEDYLHNKALKLAFMLITNFGLFFLAATAIYALLMITLKTDPFAMSGIENEAASTLTNTPENPSDMGVLTYEQ
jgi:succinate dehydrogenase / fumarate reductase membrane anchor subunit